MKLSQRHHRQIDSMQVANRSRELHRFPERVSETVVGACQEILVPSLLKILYASLQIPDCILGLHRGSMDNSRTKTNQNHPNKVRVRGALSELESLQVVVFRTGKYSLIEIDSTKPSIDLREKLAVQRCLLDAGGGDQVVPGNSEFVY